MTVRLQLVGAGHSVPAGMEELPGKVNYFVGNDAHHWHRDIPIYARVVYRHVYPGIDLVYYTRRHHVEYDWVLHPGADPGRIQVRVDAPGGTHLDRWGNLVAGNGALQVRQGRPTVYQDVGRARLLVAGRYRALTGGTLGVQIGRYDRHKTLIIDPVLTYSTYLGSRGTQFPGVAVDDSGNIYVAGETNGPHFPTKNPLQTETPSLGAGFVTKLNPNATGADSLVYSTYLGIAGEVIRGGIKVDAAGDAYVFGSTGDSHFPTKNAYQPTFGGLLDDFVTKLNSSGDALLYSTFLGGSGEERNYNGMAMAIDNAGHAYVTGHTLSTDFPTTANAYRPASPGGPGGVVTYMAELDSTSSGAASLLYSTYLDSNYGGRGIALDTAGDAYITGDGGALIKVDPHASGAASLVFELFLRASQITGDSIALDAAGNVYVTGYVNSPDLQTKNAYQSAHGGGGNDAFVAKIDPTGNVLYSTYLGGTGYDAASGVAVDVAGDAFVTGFTSSPNFPIVGAIENSRVGGTCAGGVCTDAYLVELSPSGRAILFSTTLGGADDDYGEGIAVDPAGNIYAAGYTFSNDFPTTACAFQPTSGDGGAFVVKIGTAPALPCTPTPQPTLAPTPQPRPSIAITRAVLARNPSATSQSVLLWHVGDSAVFLVTYRARHSGTYRLRGSLQVRNRGRTVYSGHMQAVGGQFQARVHLTRSFLGQPVARFTLTLGPAKADRLLRFTVSPSTK